MEKKNEWISDRGRPSEEETSGQRYEQSKEVSPENPWGIAFHTERMVNTESRVWQCGQNEQGEGDRK